MESNIVFHDFCSVAKAIVDENFSEDDGGLRSAQQAFVMALVVCLVIAGFYVYAWRELASLPLHVTQFVEQNQTVCPSAGCASMSLEMQVGRVVVIRYGFLPVFVEGYGSLEGYHFWFFMSLLGLGIVLFKRFKKTDQQ